MSSASQGLYNCYTTLFARAGRTASVLHSRYTTEETNDTVQTVHDIVVELNTQWCNPGLVQSAQLNQTVLIIHNQMIMGT